MAKKKITIKIDPNNPRHHSDRNKELISKSLKDNGAGRSILADANGIVIAGNGTYEQAQKLGIPIKVIKTNGDELVVIQREDLSTDDARRKSLVIADNATTDTSTWDFEKLENEYFDDIDFEEWDVLPFEEKKAESAKDDGFVPSEKIQVSVSRGDLMEFVCQDGRVHRLLCGDSTNLDDLNLLMGNVLADLG